MGVGIGLDPGADSVKIVKVRAGPGGVSILSAARVPRPSGGEFPAAEVARALSRAGIPRRAACGISGRDLMLRYVAVPPVPPWRLKMLVDFEIRENMAGGGTDITSDYRPLTLPGGLEQGIVVLAAVAKNAYLEEALERARECGVRVKALSPSAVALHRAFVASREFRSDETTFLLDIGRENIEMAVQRDGGLLFARNGSGSGGERVTQGIDGAFGIGRDRAETYKRERARLNLQPPADPDKRRLLIYGALREAGDAIVGAVTSGLRFARMQTKIKDLDFDRLVLSGGGARLAGLKEFLQNRLERPVSLFDPAAAMDSSRLRGDQARTFGGAPSEMAIATGLAVMDATSEGFSLSLLPPAEAARRRFWSRTVLGYAAGFLAAALAGTIFFRARTGRAASAAESEMLAGEVKQLSTRAGDAKKLDDGNRLLRDELSVFLDEAKANRAILDFLRLQRTACPDGIGLRRLKLIDLATLHVEFEGAARGLEESAFLAKLEEFQRAIEAGEPVKPGSVKMNQLPARNDETDERAFRGEVVLDPWGASARSGAESPAPDLGTPPGQGEGPAAAPDGAAVEGDATGSKAEATSEEAPGGTPAAKIGPAEEGE
ncbi:MAG: pilus assembly protein PilM [Planctomycetota bacterium]|jgi:type IV pilus assembly protein PilM